MKKKQVNRRKFIGTVSSGAAAFTIVPRHVLGKGHVPPSDKINVANIGCGTQGLREMPDMFRNEDIHVAAICDVNKYTTDYLDWSSRGIVQGIARTLEKKDWGKYIKGVPGGRDIMEEYVNTYYSNKYGKENYTACKVYEDYRELFEKETDIDAVKIMTPDHSHGPIAMTAMKKGIHVITHKPISNRLIEGLKVIDGVEKYNVRSHLLAWEDKPNYRLIKQWIDDGVIGTLREIHNWSMRPVWPQFTNVPKETPSIPQGFNWQLWLGPEKDRPYHPNYTHNVFRGWYDFGGGSMCDMGHYSLFPLFRTLSIDKAPLTVRALSSTTRTSKNNVCMNVNNKAAFPGSCIVKFRFGNQTGTGPFDLFWYDGGMRPFAPEELEDEGKDLALEGMMFVGDDGKILAGFEGEDPRILNKQTRDSYGGDLTVDVPVVEKKSVTWAKAIKSGEESPGSFLYARNLTETLNLGAVALRTKKRIEYDAETRKVTNSGRANRFMDRDYREGWEIV